MAAEVTAATQLLIVCNPNNPTGTHLPAAEIAAFCERIPPHVTVILDEAYVEFQTARRPRRDGRPARRLPQPGRPAHLQQGLRPRRAAGRLRARLGQASAPRSTPCASRSASTPSPRRPGPRRSCTTTTSLRRVEATIAERLRVEEGLRELGLATADTQANFSWIDLGDADEARGRRRPRRAPDRGPPRHPARRPRPHPGQLRHRARRTTASSRPRRDLLD